MISISINAFSKAVKVFCAGILFGLLVLSCSKDDGLGSNYQVTYVLEGPAVVAQVQYTPTIMRRVMRRFQRQLMLEQFWVN